MCWQLFDNQQDYAFIARVWRGEGFVFCLIQKLNNTVMTKIKILRPPRVNVDMDGKSGFWKQIGMIIIGTTISLTFTVVAARMSENHQRAKDRRLTSMMVISAISDYEQGLQGLSEMMARTDSVAQWLLNHPVEELELLPEEELQSLLDEGTNLYYLSYDDTYEKIFSNSIDTWKNLHSYTFIDNVGMCFAAMRSTTSNWNQWGDEILQVKTNIKAHPDEYPGTTFVSKCLRNVELRNMMGNIHKQCCWLNYKIEMFHYDNMKNMAIMHITEKELQAFLMERENPIDIGIEEPDWNYDITPIPPERLTTFRDIDARIEQLKSEGGLH